MNYEQFIYWLKGYTTHFYGYILTPAQFKVITDTLKEVKPDSESWPYTVGVNSVPLNMDVTCSNSPTTGASGGAL